MDVKIQFDMASLLQPYTYLEQGSKPGEKPSFNLATGEVVEMKAGDPAKQVGLTVYASNKPGDRGMLFVKDVPVGDRKYLEYLRGILDARELLQLGELARVNFAHDHDSYRKGGDPSKISAETDELTRLSSIPPTDRLINDQKTLGVLAATAHDTESPLAPYAVGLLGLVAQLAEKR